MIKEAPMTFVFSVITATALLSYLAYKTLDAYKESEIEFLKSKSEQVDKASQERQTSLTNRWEPLTDDVRGCLHMTPAPDKSYVLDCVVSSVEPDYERVRSWKDGDDVKVERKFLGWYVRLERQGMRTACFAFLANSEPELKPGDRVEIVVRKTARAN